MKRISFIEAPICAGSPTDGSQYAYTTLKPHLRELFRDSAVFCDIPQSRRKGEPSAPNLQSLHEVIDISRSVYETVRGEMAKGCFPIVVGGDHSVAMGSIAAASESVGARNISVVYIDGHADIHTEKTTQSGCIHGMPLAQAMGLCTRELDVGAEKIHLYGKNLFLVGPRSIDEGEYPTIEREGVTLFTVETVRESGVDAFVETLLSRIATPYIYISFDVDCMNGEEFAATGYRMPGGFTFEEAQSTLTLLAKSGKVVGIDLVEYNPRLDPKADCRKLLLSMLASVMNIQA